MEKEGIFQFVNRSQPMIIGSDDNTYLLDDDWIKNQVTHSIDLFPFSGDKILYNSEDMQIIKILQRGNISIPGVLCLSSRVILGVTRKKIPQKKFIPYDKSLPHFKVATRKQNQSSDVYAVIRFNSYEYKQQKIQPIGEMVSIIGNIGDQKAEFEYLEYIHNIKWKRYQKYDFANLVNELDSEDSITRRHTFQECVISVDPDGCKDADDALHVKYISDTVVEVGVHIADVTYFIKPGDDIDKEAFKRGQSVYLENKQINMLPEILATDLCSLLENKKRPTFSTIFKIDIQNNTIQQVQFLKGFVINKKNYTYDEAEKVIQQNKKYCQEAESLINLYQVGQKLYNISSDKEYDVNFVAYDTHKMVEIFMLLTNTYVARYLAENIPDHVLLRKHKQNVTQLDNKKIPEDVFDKIKVINMERATYEFGIQNSYHYGVNEKYYTHFTSPIRRYADIVVHRLLTMTLNKSKLNFKLDKMLYEHLNMQQKYIKKAERESYLLRHVFNFYQADPYDTYGYIIRIDDNILLINIPELNVDSESKVFSNKLKNILNYSSNENQLYMSDSNNLPEFYLNIGQKVKIRIVISIKAHSIRKKFLVQIIDPDPIPYTLKTL